MRIFIIILFTCVVTFTVKAGTNQHLIKKEKVEAQVLAKVHALPEVMDFFNYAKKSERAPALIIDDEPSQKFKYYTVKMNYGGAMFSTIDRFCVDPKTMQVYYWDVMADDMGFSDSAIITLAQWHRWRNTAAWQKPHTYKHGKLVALAKQ